ncbi:hypothetical protein Tco_0110854 [Tanacetum coccineum]
MVDDDPVGRKSVQTSRKGKEIMYEFPGPSPTKESQVSVTNYKIAIINGKAKVVEVETNELPKNYFMSEVNYDGVFNEYPLSVYDELVLDDNWQYEGLAVDDVEGSSKHCDLVHENVVYNGHSLPNMDKEIFSNNVVLDDVVTDTLAYTLPLVLKKKCSNKVNVTRKTRCLNNSKTMRLWKGCGKRVVIGGHGRGLGRLIGLNVDAVDDDPQVTKQVSLPARSSNTEVKDLE